MPLPGLPGDGQSVRNAVIWLYGVGASVAADILIRWFADDANNQASSYE